MTETTEETKVNIVKLTRFDKLKGVVWYDGNFIKSSQAKTHILDHSLHFASSVFEGIRVYNYRPFKIKEHLKRFLQSANLLDFKIPFNIKDLEKRCDQLIKKNNIRNGYLRPIAWRGSGSMSPHSIGIGIKTAIAIWEWPSYYSKNIKEKGISLTFAKWKRPSNESAPTQSKCSGLYQICSLSKNEAFRKGYDDALMLDYRNYVAETTSSNIFFLIKNKLVTPKADCFLNGITRKTVIKLCNKLNIDVIEKHILKKDIRNAEECFVTGTAAEITPVNRIGNIKYKIYKDSITNKIYSEFKKLI
tara:strand:- start:406 stop:1314 length:909 start_codon:yes stop_codon:yes gene_type:complete